MITKFQEFTGKLSGFPDPGKKNSKFLEFFRNSSRHSERHDLYTTASLTLSFEPFFSVIISSKWTMPLRLQTFCSISVFCLARIFSNSLSNWCTWLSYSLSSARRWSFISVCSLLSRACSCFWCCCRICLYTCIWSLTWSLPCLCSCTWRATIFCGLMVANLSSSLYTCLCKE